MLYRPAIVLLAILVIISGNILEIWAGKVKYKFKEVIKKQEGKNCPIKLNSCKMVKNENKERVLDCELVTEIPDDENEITMTWVLYNKMGNGWVESSLVQERDTKLCEFIEREALKSILDPLFEKSNIARTCPHKSGTYNIKGYGPADNYPDIKDGSYKLGAKIGYKGLDCNELEVLFDVEQKVSK